MGNSLSPAFVKQHYRSNGHEHTMTFSVILEDGFEAGSEPSLIKHGGGSVLLSTAMLAIAAKIKPFFHTTDNITVCDVYSQPTPTDEPLFIFAADIAVAGTNSSTDITAGEFVANFRTAHRGGYKMYLMESAADVNQRIVDFTGAAIYTDLAAVVCGSDSVIYGRNNDKPFLMTSIVTKINDVLRRKYLTP